MVWWNLRKSASAHVGVELLPDGVALACRSGSGADASIADVALLSCAPSQRQELLTDYVSRAKLQDAPCNLVLAPSQYQLLLVEAPQVPEEEMRAAVRWRLKDLVNIPLESAVVDLFHHPSDATRSGKRMIFIVVTERDTILNARKLLEDSGLRLSVIDISEMSLRNLTLMLPAEETDGRGVAMVRVREGAGSLGLYRNGDMYLSRQFELNYGGGLLDDLPGEDLVLEIQRSLDYSERQMGQAPPSAIYICGDNISEDKITEPITQGLAVPVRALRPGAFTSIQCEQDDAIQQACVGAIGAAMRREGWS